MQCIEPMRRIGLVTKALDCLARGFAGYPGDAAGAGRDLAVEGERGFQGDEGQAGANPFGEVFIRLLRILDAGFQYMHFDSRTLQLCKSSTGNRGIRILHHSVNLFYSGLDDCFRARAGAAGGRARLQAYVKVRSARPLARSFQSNDFGVVEFVVVVKSLTNRSTILDDNSSHARIWMSESHAFAGQLKRIG